MQKYFIVYNHDEASERISRVPLSIDPFKYARKKTVQREKEVARDYYSCLFIIAIQPMSLVRCSATIFLFVPCFYSALLFRSFFFLSFFPLQCSTTRLVGCMLSQVHLYHCVSRFVTLWYHGHQPNQMDGENQRDKKKGITKKKYISVDSALFVFLFLSEIAIHAKQRTGFSFVFVC